MGSILRFKTFLLCFLIFQFFGSYSLSPKIDQQRIALVIGMSAYKEVDPLPLCKSDADSIAKVLRLLNFEVIEYKDLSKQEMEDAITQWASVLKNYDVGLFYYSGHGAEVQGENYLFPVDARKTTPAQQKYSTVSVGQILDVFAAANDEKDSKLKTNLLILDACRDNPYTKSWSKSVGTDQGLGKVPAPDGTFIGFATAAGKVASAIGTTNSPYTKAILQNILTPNETIYDVFTDINATTRYLTGGEQTPYISGSLNGKFYFRYNPSITKSLSESNSETNASQTIADKIVDFGHLEPLGSTLNDVIVKEYGNAASGSVNYDDLPVAPECKNRLIKYYWLYLKNSKHLNAVKTYLEAYGLANQIRDDSYVVYMFSDNKLVLISLRLFFFQIDFHKHLAESFNIDINKYPSKFGYNNGSFYTFFALEPNINVSTIAVGIKDISNYCSLYWYGEPPPDK